jgi:hypothetical protein
MYPESVEIDAASERRQEEGGMGVRFLVAGFTEPWAGGRERSEPEFNFAIGFDDTGESARMLSIRISVRNFFLPRT